MHVDERFIGPINYARQQSNHCLVSLCPLALLTPLSTFVGVVQHAIAGTRPEAESHETKGSLHHITDLEHAPCAFCQSHFAPSSVWLVLADVLPRFRPLPLWSQQHMYPNDIMFANSQFFMRPMFSASNWHPNAGSAKSVNGSHGAKIGIDSGPVLSTEDPGISSRSMWENRCTAIPSLSCACG
jgi:hypothetical protein